MSASRPAWRRSSRRLSRIVRKPRGARRARWWTATAEAGAEADDPLARCLRALGDRYDVAGGAGDCPGSDINREVVFAEESFRCGLLGHRRDHLDRADFHLLARLGAAVGGVAEQPLRPQLPRLLIDERR